jgi:rhamnose utilization protein RhaD (predicted bifunctional aldolase and dehydrogenase)
MTSPDPVAALRQSPEYARLLAASVRLGRNPLQVQGAGGNTSLKGDGAMWVKASGTWLADAETRDIMVPVDAAALTEALSAGGEPDAKEFVAPPGSPGGLRPSIETTLHAAMPQRVVLHTHCVATIALAIRRDGVEVIRQRLADLKPIMVPYVMPGLPLARALMAQAGPDRRVAILGNHGLIVAGETVAEAEELLNDVARRLDPGVAELMARHGATEAELKALESAHYRAAEAPALHAVAHSPQHLALAAKGPFYPDHVIFLEPRLCIAEPGESVEAVATRLAGEKGPPRLILVPGVGAAIHREAPLAAEAMARGLGDVIARVPVDAPVQALPDAEVAALLGWDAEKYRQQLSAAPARG